MIGRMSEEPRFRPVDPVGLRVRQREWDVLAAAAYDAGTAGVCRDPADGGLWLCGRLEDGQATFLPGDDATFVEVDGQFVSAGRVPPAAARILVRESGGAWAEAVIAGGVWLAVTDAGPFAHRVEDADHALIRSPLPDGARVLEPLDDATDACVVCDTVAWDLVSWLPRPVGPHAWEDEEDADGLAAVCRRCGHVVEIGGSYGSSDLDTSDMPEEEQGDDGEDELTDAERLAWARIGFAEAGFPAYGLADWHGDRQWSGASTTDDDDGPPRTTAIALDHHAREDGDPPRVQVVTSFREAEEPPRAVLRDLLRRLAGRRLAGPWASSLPALMVRLERNQLVTSVAADLALVEEIEVPIDGVPHPFLMARCAGGWAAFGVLDAGDERPDRCALTIAVTATDQPFAPFALAEVVEIEPYLRRPVA